MYIKTFVCKVISIYIHSMYIKLMIVVKKSTKSTKCVQKKMCNYYVECVHISITYTYT